MLYKTNIWGVFFFTKNIFINNIKTIIKSILKPSIIYNLVLDNT